MFSESLQQQEMNVKVPLWSHTGNAEILNTKQTLGSFILEVVSQFRIAHVQQSAVCTEKYSLKV